VTKKTIKTAKATESDTTKGTPSTDACPPTDWQFATPQLEVPNVREAQAYYRDMLGFKIAWNWQEETGTVYNGSTEVFFVREQGEITPTCTFVRVENADAVLAVYRERSVRIVEEIASHAYGMRESTIADAYGHRFRIGHSSGPIHPPIEGEDV
jgi:catechol 2,3-dioxygenase-like lactoylglutathione lyase family enzyme